MSGRSMRDPAWAMAAYEAVRHRLPAAKTKGAAVPVSGIADIADRYDAFLLDAFGVLNVGQTAIPGASEAVAALQEQGKRVLVLTNGATHPRDAALAKYRRLGFDFAPEDVVASRDALQVALAARTEKRWGVMAIPASRLEDFGVAVDLLGDDPAAYRSCDGFILLGSGEWTDVRQTRLTEALREAPRPVLVGNPDIVAPRETGLSLEPGHFAHLVADETGVRPEFFGKPFANIYDLALSRLDGVPRDRVLAVGDTLHTDVLGGAEAGVATMLTTGFGLFANMDASAAIQSSGIVPDWVSPSL